MSKIMSDSKRRKNKAEKIAPGSCMLCRTTEDDEFFFGKFYEAKFQGSLIHVHYYCILFACGLAQNGRSSREGIEGFLVKDIISESNRGARLRCSYCGLTGATVGCSLKKCKKVFHLHCGRRNGSLNEFFGQFCTYCVDHKQRQKILGIEDEQDILCSICCSAIELEDPDSFLKAPCCASNLFHRKCIQLYALSAGYFFKCPLCNDKPSFEREMLNYGIHIPKQDASWEKERNAFQELLIRAKCDAAQCICPKGRQENQEESMWHLVYCEDCGSTGRHVGCEKLSLTKRRTWKCADCKVFDKKFSKTRKKTYKYQIYPDSEAGTSSTARNIRISANAKKLLQNCKSCSVHLKPLCANDLPRTVNTARKYRHVLKRIRIKSSSSSTAKPKNKHSSKESIKKGGNSGCNNRTKSRPNLERSKYSKGVASPKRNNENRTSKPTCSSFIVKNTTQTLMNQFLQNNQNATSHHQKIKQTLIDGFLKNNMDKKNHTKPIFMENEEKYVAIRVKAKRSVKCQLKQMNKITEFTSMQSFVNHHKVTIKKSVSQTVNIYFDTKPDNSDPMPELRKYDDDDDSEFNMSFIKNQNYDSQFNQLIQKLKSVTPAAPTNFLECETEVHLPKENIASKISTLKRKTTNELNAANEISEKRICRSEESIRKIPGNMSEHVFKSKDCQSKRNCHLAGGSHRGYAYINSEFVDNVRIVDNQFLTLGTSATLSVALENCLLQSDDVIRPQFQRQNQDIGISCQEQVLDVVPVNKLASFNSESKHLTTSNVTLESSEEISSILKSAENIMKTKVNFDLLYRSIPSTFGKRTLTIDRLFNVSVRPTTLMANSILNMQSVALQKSDRSVQLDSTYFSFPSAKFEELGNEKNDTSFPMHSTPALTCEKKCTNSKISPVVQQTDGEIGTVGKQLEKFNIVKVKEELLSCGCLSGAHPDNACIKKRVFPAGSSLKPSPDNEKKKKRSKYSTEKADKKAQQTNTLLSYFYGL